MDNRKQDLSSYRLSQAEDSIKVAQMSYDDFYIAGKEEAAKQIETAVQMIKRSEKICWRKLVKLQAMPTS